MQCTPNGKIFQYEIGKEYKEDEADLCHCGFHACENPLDVLSYYNNIDDKFCEVELDEIDPNRNKDSKICGKKIKIGIEIGFLGLFKAGIEWIQNKTIFTKEDFEKLLSSYNTQIGSSGDYAQIGSSGYSTKIGSSGDYAQISSSGDDCIKTALECNPLLHIGRGLGNFLDIEPLSMIPEFNPDHFGVSKRYDYYWWPIDDYHSRIKAFDKLISEYRLNK